MKVAVLSGKGGTGKTFVSVNLAVAAGTAIYIDCDVEAPNGRLFLNPYIEHTVSVSKMIPKVDPQKCNGCRKCVELCEFHALVYMRNRPKVFSDVCHSCGGCTLVCPTQAITEETYPIGRIEEGVYQNNKKIQVITGIQNEGIASGVPIIQRCIQFPQAVTEELVVIDCPPGSACSVMESIADVDFCILVIEPTAFGFHNFQMVYELVKLLGRKMGVIINKAEEPYHPLEKFLEEQNITVLQYIPYSMELAASITAGNVIVENNQLIFRQFREILQTIQELISKDIDDIVSENQVKIEKDDLLSEELLEDRKEVVKEDIKEDIVVDNAIEEGIKGKQILVLSGKGGTGKTTTACALAQILQAKYVADCDVDAPNFHLVSSINIAPIKKAFLGGRKAVIDYGKCTNCGICMKHCKFGAIQGNTINNYACEGCGVCAYTCPVEAVTLEEDVAGELALYHSKTVFSTAKLKMGRGNSGKLVTEVKNTLREYNQGDQVAIIDGSPGIGCPVIASMKGVDMVLIVTEPSLSGQSDLKRLIHTACIFQVPVAVCINKYDVNLEQTKYIRLFCQENSIPIVGEVPYNKAVSKMINKGCSVMELKNDVSDAYRVVCKNTINQLKETVHKE